LPVLEDNMTTTIVFYDGECAFCTCWARRGQAWLDKNGFQFKPFENGRAQGEMRVVTSVGESLGGADTIAYLCRQIWWAWPAWLLSRVPGVMPVSRWIYRRVAANRYCLNDQCEFKSATSVWPAILLPAAALLWRSLVPAWVFMWAMVGALFGGAIGLSGWRPHVGKVGGWLGFWRMALGAALFWGVARWMTGELARGWAGMIGLVLMLHFGLVQWLTATLGFESIMQEPVRARSVREFWSARWNRVFPEMMRPLVFEPVAKRWGAAVATMGVFAVSGLLHELVISLPAGGGYGLPTSFFLIQGAGVLAERRMAARIRRVFAWLVVVGPVFWLFHPLFVKRVVIPMMEALGAL
jgi:predicted DCC family thiol-disulfide oxidoreductase YuxK